MKQVIWRGNIAGVAFRVPTRPRHSTGVVYDSPSCEALAASQRRTGLPRLPKHRSLVVGDTVTFQQSGNHEVNVVLDQVSDTGDGQYFRGHNADDVWDTTTYIGLANDTYPAVWKP